MNLCPRHAMGVGHAQQLAFQRHALLVDRIELLDQRLDPRIIEMHGVEFGDDRVAAGRRISRLCLVRSLPSHARGNELVLQFAEGVKSVEIASSVSMTPSRSSASMAESESVTPFIIVVVFVIIGLGRGFVISHLLAIPFGLGSFVGSRPVVDLASASALCRAGRWRGRVSPSRRPVSASRPDWLRLLAAIGGVEIDNVAQQDFAFMQARRARP